MLTRLQASQQLAQWLSEEHPDIYAILQQKALAAQAGFSGLGDDGDFSDFTPTLTDIQFDPGSVSLSDSVTQSINEGWDISSADDAIRVVNVVSSPNVVAPTSGSSGGILDVASSVGHFLASPQGLQTLGNVAAATIATVGAVQVAQTQLAIVQAQSQKAAAGQSPAPISYAANGTPIYVGASSTMPSDLAAAIRDGTAHAVVMPDGSVGYTLTGSVLSSVLNLGSLPWYVWVMLAGAVLLAVS